MKCAGVELRRLQRRESGSSEDMFVPRLFFLLDDAKCESSRRSRWFVEATHECGLQHATYGRGRYSVDLSANSSIHLYSIGCD